MKKVGLFLSTVVAKVEPKKSQQISVSADATTADVIHTKVQEVADDYIAFMERLDHTNVRRKLSEKPGGNESDNPWERGLAKGTGQIGQRVQIVTPDSFNESDLSPSEIGNNLYSIFDYVHTIFFIILFSIQ